MNPTLTDTFRRLLAAHEARGPWKFGRHYSAKIKKKEAPNV